ncbi:MAG: alpha-L-fucosidase [Bacteroidales bacterium]|nr:alpha-L-fucosidase [Bacteroidales bacterium]
MKKLLPFLLTLMITLFFQSCQTTNDQESESGKPEAFIATVESLQNYKTPDWFRDAKFGIYMHWGAYSVAEMGEWYARNLYLEGTKDYEHHVKTYGHPSEFGYKDFIPLWKAENFDPDKLVGLFKESGAKYFAPCAVHHDNFDLWDSKHHRFNAVNMGPEMDLIGMWKEATLKHGLKFGVTTHLSRSYSWINTSKLSDKEGPLAGVPYDGNDPEWEELYHEKHDDIHQRAPYETPVEWRELWANRIKDLIDNYQPDHLYFDCAVPFRGEDKGKTGMDVIAHYYNKSMERNDGKLESVMCIKERPWQGLYADGLATLDFERGKANDIRKDPWQTDDSLGPWGYRAGADYMTTNALVDKFIDIVSKNGNLLLNVPIKADGTLDEQTTSILEEMGEWMAINGEGIYGTRPFYMFGEGPTNEIPHKVIESPYTKKDIRYTTKDGVLYAFVLDWPGKGKTVLCEHLAPMNTRIGTISNVTMLGYDGELKWEQHPNGLMVDMPEKAPNANAIGLKISFEGGVWSVREEYGV